jgi:hypothetical protein
MDRLNRLNLVVNTIVEERAQRFADRTLEVSSFSVACFSWIARAMTTVYAHNGLP